MNEFKADFQDAIKERNRLKIELANLEVFAAEHGKKGSPRVADCKNALVEDLKNLRLIIKDMYKAAIVLDVDLEDCRLLNVYRFFFRNLVEINVLLRNVRLPSGSNAIWGIVVLTAIIFLYAAV